MSSKEKRGKTVKSKLNVFFVLVPKNICSYINLYCATVCFFCLISFYFSLSLSGASSKVSLCTSTATVQPQSASCGLASAKLTGWLHEKTASFRNSTHCTVWTRQLLSAKDKQTDRERRQRERERERNRREERGRHENMWGSKGAREQSRTCENAAVSFFLYCIALTTCMKLECHKMLNMGIISLAHTLTQHVSTHLKHRHV